MKRLIFSATVAAVATLSACSNNDATGPSSANEDDYALVVFGQSGAALQGTMGEQGGRPFDGRTGMPPLPEELKLTDAQKADMQALRDAFRAAHQSQLDALHAIFAEAKAARDGGATREEVRAILGEGRAIGESLRPDVEALHTAMLAVLTDAQRAWLEAHRPSAPPDIDGRRRRPPPRGGRPGNG